jgi:hypothetical protein
MHSAHGVMMSFGLGFRNDAYTRAALYGTLLAAGLLTACTTLPSEPVNVLQFNVEYTKLAACSYEHAAKDGLDGLRLTELRATNTILINKDIVGSSVTPLWEARFVKERDNLTHVEFKEFPAIWGPGFNSRAINGYVQACAQQ